MSDFAINVIGPVVLLIGFGYVLYKCSIITDEFVTIASGLIFNFALPTLLFVNVSTANLSLLFDIKSISVGISATLIVFICSILAVSAAVKEKQNKGVMVQGIFRANMGIIGLAYCAKAYGDEGLALAAVYMGCLTIVYNMLSVFVLNLYNDKRTNLISVLWRMLTNPIIVGMLTGMLVAGFEITLPDIATITLGYFSQLTLPLALICTGAALRFTALGKLWKLVGISVLGKCIIYPVVMMALAISFNVEGIMLGILFLMAASPTAAASYVMVKKIGGNDQLAAQIVAVTTVTSLPLTIVGFYMLSLITDYSF